MQFCDKLFQLRKQAGLTQAELAEKVNVSRQTISKWEMGTAVPDVNNILAISKLFFVSIDYLANNEIESELDVSVVKAAATSVKMSAQYIIIRVVIALCVISAAAIFAMRTNSFSSVFMLVLNLCFLLLIYYVVRLLVIFFSNRTK